MRQAPEVARRDSADRAVTLSELAIMGSVHILALRGMAGDGSLLYPLKSERPGGAQNERG